MPRTGLVLTVSSAPSASCSGLKTSPCRRSGNGAKGFAKNSSRAPRESHPQSESTQTCSLWTAAQRATACQMEREGGGGGGFGARGSTDGQGCDSLTSFLMLRLSMGIVPLLCRQVMAHSVHLVIQPWWMAREHAWSSAGHKAQLGAGHSCLRFKLSVTVHLMTHCVPQASWLEYAAESQQGRFSHRSVLCFQTWPSKLVGLHIWLFGICLAVLHLQQISRLACKH